MKVGIRDFDRYLQASRSRPVRAWNSAAAARERLRGLFDLACPDANAMNSNVEHARAAHLDLSSRSDDEIHRERILLKIRWALADRPTDWLVERLARLDGEAAMRRPPARRR